MKVYLLFNKTTKQFMSFCESLENIPTGNFLTKEIELESLGITNGVFNLARYRWEGDWESGSLVDMFKENKSVVQEEDINKKYEQLFFRKYSIEQCILEIMDIFKNDQSYINASPMVRFFDALQKKKEKELSFYSGSKNHVVENQQHAEERLDKAFKV